MKEIAENSIKDVQIFLVGNQLDLSDSENNLREVSLEEGKNYQIKHMLCGFNEASAKNGINVENTFLDISHILYKNYHGKNIDHSIAKKKINLRNINKPKVKKRLC